MKKILSKAVLLGGLLAGIFAWTAAAEEFLFRSTIIGSNPNISIGGVPSGARRGLSNKAHPLWRPTESFTLKLSG